MKKNQSSSVFLTKKELKQLRFSGACRSACEKLVARVIKHYELAEVESVAIWDAIIAKYKLDPKKIWSFNYYTGEVYLQTHGDRYREIQDHLEARDLLVKNVEKTFGLKK